jgi:hypothetical protein
MSFTPSSSYVADQELVENAVKARKQQKVDVRTLAKVEDMQDKKSGYEIKLTALEQKKDHAVDWFRKAITEKLANEQKEIKEWDNKVELLIQKAEKAKEAIKDKNEGTLQYWNKEIEKLEEKFEIQKKVLDDQYSRKERQITRAADTITTASVKKELTGEPVFIPSCSLLIPKDTLEERRREQAEYRAYCDKLKNEEFARIEKARIQIEGPVILDTIDSEDDEN